MYAILDRWTYDCCRAEAKRHNRDDHPLKKERYIRIARNRAANWRFNCSICGFRTKGKHEFSIHVNEHKGAVAGKSDELVPLKCAFCPFITYVQEDFNVHISSHRPAKPYKCAYCDCSGFVRSKVLQHCKNQHLGCEASVLTVGDSVTGASANVHGSVKDIFRPFVQLHDWNIMAAHTQQQELSKCHCQTVRHNTM